MLQEVIAIFSIIGIVVGSGFISGKEVVVFFSRFGIYSFFTVFLSFFVFFFLFKLILNCGEQFVRKFQSSKILYIINLILSTILSSSMFASLNNLLNFNEKLINFAIFCCIFVFCCLIFKKGGKFFNKINIILVPFMLVLFIFMLLLKIRFPENVSSCFGFASVFYAILYCSLNVSNGCVMMLTLGRNFNKKQKTRVAFFSALALSVILLAANVVLLANPECLLEEMPMLSIFTFGSSVIKILIFIGSLTTLFSIIYSTSCSIREGGKNEVFNFLISIGIPFVLSLMGFSCIVEYLYPVASALGVVFLIELFFISSFKQANKKIHSCSKNAKNKDASHNDIKF